MDKPAETPQCPSVFQKSCSQGVPVPFFSGAVFQLARFISFPKAVWCLKILLPNSSQEFLTMDLNPQTNSWEFPLNSLEIGSRWMWTNTTFSCKNLDLNRREVNMLHEMAEIASHVTWTLILKRAAYDHFSGSGLEGSRSGSPAYCIPTVFLTIVFEHFSASILSKIVSD